MATLPLIGCLLSRAHDYNQPDRPPTSPLHRQLMTNQSQKRSSSSSRRISTTHSSTRWDFT